MATPTFLHEGLYSEMFTITSSNSTTYILKATDSTRALNHAGCTLALVAIAALSTGKISQVAAPILKASWPADITAAAQAFGTGYYFTLHPNVSYSVINAVDSFVNGGSRSVSLQSALNFLLPSGTLVAGINGYERTSYVYNYAASTYQIIDANLNPVPGNALTTAATYILST